MSKQKKEKETYASLSSIIKNNWFILKIAMKEAPFYTIHTITSGMLHEIVVFIEHIFMIGYIIDCIQYGRPFWHAALFIITVFVVLRIIQIVGNIWLASIKPKGEEKIYKKIKLELYNKASKIDLQCYDDPKFYTDFVWAMSDVSDRFQKVMTTISNFIGAIVGMIVIGGYILSTDWVGIIFTLVAFVGTVLVYNKINKLVFKVDIANKPLIRKRDYINRVFYLCEFAKEIRTGNIKEKLFKDFSDANSEIEDNIKKKTKWLPLLNFAGTFVFEHLMFDGLYLIYLLFKTMVQKAMSFGTLYTLSASAGNLSQCILNLGRVIPEFQQHSMYIEKIRAFLDYDIKITDDKNAIDIPKDFKEIVLSNVSFRYSADSKDILKNINMSIKKGEKIALVGYNGAGKTTLVKLLMRLYDVSGGKITYNDNTITDYKVEDYRHQFGTVFQDYQLFAASLRENVVMDTVSEADKPAVDKKVTNALVESGFTDKLEALTEGLDTSLTREFDDEGTGLSGGESQKVAIGRVLYKECPIIILDEPSSALDPISEYNLNNTMLNMSSEKTVIFISHRLSTTKMADRIYMLEEGEIVECGTHDELLKHNGKYAEMFTLQAEKYR